MPELKPVTTTSSTLSIVFGAVLVVLAAAGIVALPGPGSAWLAASPTPASAPTRSVSVSTPAPSALATPAEAATAATPSPRATAMPAPATPTALPSTPTPSRTAAPTTYVIQAGDTLLAIAEKFGVSGDSLLRANNLASPDELSEGQELVIPLQPTAVPSPTGAATPAPSVTPAPTPTPTSQVYVVAPGDTLGGIAERFGVSVETIKQANGLEDADTLSEGQELTIPAPGPDTPPPAAATPRPATTYVVEEGDTLLDIAARFGVAVEDLLRFNGLDDADDLSLGQELTIP